MKRCASPDHPHCTHWVMPGERACAHGHAQPADGALGDSFDMISRLRAGRDDADAIRPAPDAAVRCTSGAATGSATKAVPPQPPAERPYLHVSGFDPRAAGGRQAVKLELRGMPPAAPNRLELLLQSDLLPDGGAATPLAFTRGLRGDWRPVFIEFSSRGREHGQYRIDVELHAREARRTWVATLLLLVPRPDASLGEIHQTFLSTHKNVRIHADDASIARIYGLEAAGPMDIDVHARNAGIARLDFGKPAAGGRIDLGLPTLAWDEDLIEIDLPAATPAGAAAIAHPCPASSACLVYAEPDAGFPRHLRLFALEECVLGRYDIAGSEADLLLRHHGGDGPVDGGLTRRLSGRHALIRPGRHGFEIEDVSRYGLLLDGAWPGKHKPVPLRLGMRIEFTASFRDVVTLVVTALHPHALVLHRVDGGGAAECFMLLAPETRPDPALAARSPHALPRAAALPLLFHRDGGIWHLDPKSGASTPLGPATRLDRLAGFHGRVRFAARPRPEDAARTDQRRADRRRGEPSQLLDA